VKTRFQNLPFKCNLRRYTAGEKNRGKNFVFALTEKGAAHIAKIDEALGIDEGKSQTA
jgi:hypothetical protein